MKNRELQEYEEQIRACVKCGICQAHCPAYRQDRREGHVARGKIRIAAALLENNVELEKDIEDDISMCLMCGSCMTKCPNSVPTHEIVGAMRRQMVQKKGLSGLGRLVSKVTGGRVLMRSMVKAGSLVSPLLMKRLPQNSGLRLRFSLHSMRGRTFPPLRFRTLFERVPVLSFGVGLAGQQSAEKETVGFFAGCAITYLYPEIGEALIQVLTQLGYSVHVPRSQQCCGIPALSSGAGETVEKLAASNVAAFGTFGEKKIITACASCYGGIGAHYAQMQGEAAAFSEQVVDYNVFLQDELVQVLSKLPRLEKRLRVTYHDPCHLKSEGILAEPRRILNALPNVDFVEMDNAALCCGLGGTFSVSHYAESQAIGAVKVEGIRESGAELVVTNCPGCIMQLQDVINHAGLSVRAVHLLDLVNAALKGNAL